MYSGKPTAAEPDVHHIDFRVGKIVSAKKHPDADTLFVEESKFFSFFFFFVCLVFRNPYERLKRKLQNSESKTETRTRISKNLKGNFCTILQLINDYYSLKSQGE